MLTATGNGSSRPMLGGLPANRLFNVFFGVDDWPSARNHKTAQTVFPLATWEDENNVYVEADAPGVLESDIEVAIEADELIIRLERKQEPNATAYDSRKYGAFEQRVTLWTPVDADNVEAKLVRGVLNILLPKSEQAKPRKIEVRSG